MKQPLIAVTPNTLPAADRPLYKGKVLEYADAAMARAVIRAGGLPVMALAAPPAAEEGGAQRGRDAHEVSAWAMDAARALVARVDGILLSGGVDVDPAWYRGREGSAGSEVDGQAAGHPQGRGTDPRRDAYEIALVRVALDLGRPLFGVCRGVQLLNVALGGTLWQDLESQREGSLVHRDQLRYDRLTHGVRLEPETWLAACLAGGPQGGEELRVTSVHHQGIRTLAPPLRPLAWAPDGLVEAVEGAASLGSWAAAVQWHPEWMPHSVGQRRMLETFIQEARLAAA